MQRQSPNEHTQQQVHLKGQFGRKVKRFTSIERTSEIPADLLPQFINLTDTLDQEASNQYDFIQHNKQITQNPLNLKLTSRAKDLLSYRMSNNS